MSFMVNPFVHAGVALPPASLVLHFDGSHLDTTTTDSSANAVAVTAVGAAIVSTTESVFGGSSARSTTSSGAYWQTAHTGLRLVGEFTVQFWLRMPSVASGQYVVAGRYVPVNGFFWIYTRGSGDLSCYALGNEVTANAGTITANTWHHVEVTRDASGVRYFFIDGMLVGSSSLLTDQVADNGWTICGADAALVGGAGGTSDCYVDDFVVVNGCLHTANFTPPASAWIP